MVVDLALCIGCNACVVACKMENDTPQDCFNTRIESWDVGEYPTVARANMPRQCGHCENAPCISVCPTGASYRADDGTVLIDYDKCIGCKYCMAACPYQSRWVDPEQGHVDKCTFCSHRTANGLLPACVSSCITHARLFGDLNDPESDVAKKMASCNAETYLDELGLNPKVRYVGLSQTLGLKRASVTHQGGIKVDKA